MRAAEARVTVREFDWGSRPDRPAVEHERVLTLPNAITAVRLFALPGFVWLVLVADALALGLVVLVVVAMTDWVDGYLARRLDQVTKLGRILDPVVDRVLIVTAALTLLAAGMLPAWLVVLVVARDVVVVGGAVLYFGGVPPLKVTRLGKTATASLLVALPAFLLVEMGIPGRGAVQLVAWLAAGAGVVAYYVAGVQYARQLRALRHERRPG